MLPYWSYTEAGNRILPPEFRRKDDPVWGSLYREHRSSATNSGVPIDAGLNPNPIQADALNQRTYRRKGAQLGFCAHLDRNLHGRVHVQVGDGVGMGDVPTAANDPIFWLHHCDIDRMWMSWNANGGRNPTDAWADRSFVLPDGRGNKMERMISSVLDASKLQYAYDALLPGPTITAATAGGPVRPVVTLARSSTAVALSDDVVQITLSPTGMKSPKIMGAGLRRQYLVLGTLSANVQPGVLYAVEVRSSAAWFVVGYIHFFDAVPHGDSGHDHMAMAGRRLPSTVSSASM
uniref:Tyrosinase family protein n=1 Tax=Phenylobacterium glaciei TaxID=2803784 RepID=A0A974S7R5_9CAUL|nr:tyrosinase family protein [Phenylobacterium glaciei]